MAGAREKLHLSDEHLIGIGYVSIRATQLEMTAKGLVDRRSRVGPLPDSLRKIVMDLGVRKHIDLLGEWYVRDLPKRRSKEINELTSKIHSALNERNDVIHSAWQRTENDEVKNLIDISLSGGIKMRRTGVTSKYLNELAERCLELSFKLNALDGDAMYARLRTRAASLDIHLLPSSPPNSEASSGTGAQKKPRRPPHQPGPSRK